MNDKYFEVFHISIHNQLKNNWMEVTVQHMVLIACQLKFKLTPRSHQNYILEWVKCSPFTSKPIDHVISDLPTPTKDISFGHVGLDFGSLISRGQFRASEKTHLDFRTVLMLPSCSLSSTIAQLEKLQFCSTKNLIDLVLWFTSKPTFSSKTWALTN